MSKQRIANFNVTERINFTARLRQAHIIAMEQGKRVGRARVKIYKNANIFHHVVDIAKNMR